MLSIVATPIGHLGDISFRALKALKEADLILSEDTRRTAILLQHYGIDTKTASYHSFKEKRSIEKILQELRKGKKLALVSDAGTPCINDPGLLLVQACLEEDIPFTAIPGPCSIIQALILSGMETKRFQYIGFLPKNPMQALRQVLAYPGTTIALESPKRLVAALKILCQIDKNARIAIAREMTKVFEECPRGAAHEMLAHFQQTPPRGEIALVLEGGRLMQDLSIEETVALLRETQGLSLKEAIRTAARLLQQPKRLLYKKMHGL